MPDNNLQRSFKYDGQIFDIPETKVQDFLNDAPDAEEVRSYTVAKDTFDIPVSEVGNFLKDAPDAKALQNYPKIDFEGGNQDTVDYGPFDKSMVERSPRAKQNFERWQEDQKEQPNQQPKTKPDSIEFDNKEREKGFWNTYVGDMGEKFAEGAAYVGEWFPRIKNMPYKVFANTIANREGLSGEEKQTVVEAMMYMNPFTSGDEAIADELKAAQKSLAEKSDRYNGKDFAELWKEGDQAAAIGDVFLQATRSIPISLGAIFGGAPAMGVIGLGTAATEYDTLTNTEKPGAGATPKEWEDYASKMDMGEFAKVSNAILKGVGEAGSEYLGSLPLLQIFKKTPGLGKGIKDSMSDVAQRFFKKYGLLTEPVVEGIEEWANQIWSNTADYLTGARKDFAPMEDSNKSFVYGFGGGAQFSMGAGAIKGVQKLRGSTQEDQPVDPEGQTPTVSPQQARDAFANQVQEKINSNLHDNGTFTTIVDETGKEWQVKSTTPGTKGEDYLVHDPESETGVRAISSQNIQGDPVIQTPDEVLNVELAAFDKQQAVSDELEKKVVEYKGEQYFLLDESELGIGLQPIVKNEAGQYEPDQTRDAEIVPKEDFEAYQQEKASQQQAEEAGQPGQPKEQVVNTVRLGKTDYKYTTDENGAFDIQLPEGLDPAKAEKEIRSTLPDDQQNRVQITQEEIEQPPEVPWGQPTRQNIVKSIKILPVGEQNVTGQPTQDNKTSESGEITEDPKYSFRNQEIDRETAQGLIEVAAMQGNIEKLDGLQVDNDPELTKLIQSSFPEKKPSYKLGNKNITPAQAKAAIIAADTQEELNSVRISNDSEFDELIKAKQSEFEQQAQEQQAEQNRAHDGLVTMLRVHNNLTPGRRRQANTAGIVQRASKLGYTVKTDKDDKLVVTNRNGSQIKYKSDNSGRQEAKNHKSFEEYEDNFKNIASLFLSPANMIGVDVGMTPKEINQSILDIQAGKKTVGAGKLLDGIENIINSNKVVFKGDAQTGQPGAEVSLEEYQALMESDTELTFEEEELAGQIPEDVAESILYGYEDISTENYNELFNDYLNGNRETETGIQDAETDENDSGRTEPESETNFSETGEKLTESVNNSENSEKKLDNLESTPTENQEVDQPILNSGSQKREENVNNEQESLQKRKEDIERRRQDELDNKFQYDPKIKNVVNIISDKKGLSELDSLRFIREDPYDELVSTLIKDFTVSDLDGVLSIHNYIKSYKSELDKKQPKFLDERISETPPSNTQQSDSEREKPVEKPGKKRKSFTDRVKKGLKDNESKRLDDLRNQLKNKLGGQLNTGLDPETFVLAAEATALIVKSGVRQFSDFAQAMVEMIGDGIRPHIAALYEYTKRSDSREFADEMTPTEEVDNMDIDEILQQNTENNVDLDNNNNEQNVSNTTGNSEQDSQNGENDLSKNERDVSSQGGRSGQNGRENKNTNSKRNKSSKSSKGGSGLFADLFGEQSDNELLTENKEPGIEESDAGITDGRGNRIDGTERSNDERKGNQGTSKGTKSISESFAERIRKKLIEQKQAEGIPVTVADINNIRETLPFLLDEQQDDVLKAETRFSDPAHSTVEMGRGKGMMFTNGTGTGKTYTGLGIVKRFIKQGKPDILVVTPSQSKVTDWSDDAKNLGIELNTLPDIVTGGTGAVVTTYANFAQNDELKKRVFDLIIYDESHRLMEHKKGEHSLRTYTHYKISNRDSGSALNRMQDVHPVWVEFRKLLTQIHDKTVAINNPDLMDEVYAVKREELDILKAREKELREEMKKLLPGMEEEAIRAVERTKSVFLSATPFKGHFNLRYVNGYLFDWGNETTYEAKSRGYSRVNPEGRFYLDNFGSAYEWKNNQLQTKQNANAEAIAMQEVQFAEKLMDKGVLSGRTINSEKDYERAFPQVSGMDSDSFNEGFGDIFNYEKDEFSELRSAAYDVFYDYNYTTKLLESLKTSMSIPRINKHLDLGRKVVVFHRRKQADVTPPFETILRITKGNAEATLELAEDPSLSPSEKPSSDRVEKARLALQQVKSFDNKYSDLLRYEKTLNYNSAIDQLSKEYGGRAMFFNGDINKKDKNKAIQEFNDDNSGVDIIVIQEESGKEGISLHDKTSKHQRVLMSLSMPISSITALQIEGRIYRIGQESDAIFEYPLLGLDLEVEHFGRNINKKLSTTENLAVGEQSRDLLRSFAEGVLFNSTIDDPSTEQGKGGKAYDKRAQQEYSEFRKAILVYNTNQKKRGRRDQREGIDYFATPEPIGQKMVEWLGLQPSEKGLEPSAGHGAIAMWFPSHANTTSIEPSYKLFSKLNARAGGGDRKVINTTFEDHNIINKYHGVAMNPPFGSGGKTAMDHLEKAFRHLNIGGRVVALVPNGGSMNKRLDKFMFGEDENGKTLNPDAKLVAEIVLPSVTFEQAGTKVNGKIVVIDKTETPKTVHQIRLEVKKENQARFMKGEKLLSPEETEKIVTERLSEQRVYDPVSRYDLSNSETIDQLFDEIEFIDIPARNIPEGQVQQTQEQPQKEKKDKFSIFNQKDTRDDSDLYMVKPNEYLGDDYQKVNDIAKSFDGYYSRYSSKAKNIQSGFLFREEENRNKFIDKLKEEELFEDNINFSLPETGIGLYSPTEKALDRISQKKGTPEQFKAMLLKNGAKQAELDWMGFDEFSQDKKSLTKAEIQEWIDQNKIQVEEVQKEDKDYSKILPDGWEIAEFPDGANVYDENGNHVGEGSSVADALADAGVRYNPQSITKYSDYQEPGGENYKEVLLTMGGNESVEYEVVKSGEENFHVYNFNGREIGWGTTRESALKNANITEKEVRQFKSSHFDEPNILAHIRFNERTDSEGNKVLFIEEWQADKGQEWQKLKKLIDSGKATKADIDRFNFLDKNFPFNKTSEWLPLAMRRMIRYAAENGFDKVAWTSGEIQAERYDLSKQVDAIHYSKSDNGTYDLNLEKNGSPAAFTKNDLTEKELEDYVGKEVAKKIVNSEGENHPHWKGTKSLSGVDIAVGGEGMKTFYNSIVPKAASKLGKKFDAKVETTEINIGNDINNETGEFIPDNNTKVLSLPITPKMHSVAISEGFPMFKRSQFLSDRLNNRQSNPEIISRLNEIQAKAPGAAKMVVGSNINDLLIDMENAGFSKSKIDFIKENGIDAIGFYDSTSDTVFINLKTIQNADQAIAVWVHENGWHKGIRNIVPDKGQLNQLYEKMYDSFEELAKTDKNIAAIVAHVRKNYSFASKATQGNEMAAKLAEKITSEEDLTPVERSLWNKVTDWFRDFLKKAFNFDSGLLSEKDISRIIKAAVQSNFQKNRNFDTNEVQEVTYKKENTGVPGWKLSDTKREYIHSDGRAWEIPQKSIKGDTFRYLQELIDNHRVKEFDPEIFDSLYRKLRNNDTPVIGLNERGAKGDNPTSLALNIYDKLPEKRAEYRTNPKGSSTEKVSGEETIERKMPDSGTGNNGTNSESFKKWFRDSKVVDENGEPLVVYHGTNADFNEFNKSISGGIFFTDIKSYVDFWSDNKAKGTGGNPSIIPAYLSIQNPKIKELKKYYGFHETNELEKEPSESPYIEKQWIDEAKAEGHDGLIIKAKDGNNYIAFSPTQIKSATGNNGEFDPTNPDITFSKPESKKQLLTDKLENIEFLNKSEKKYKEAPEVKTTRQERWNLIREFWNDLNLPIRRLEELVSKRGGTKNDRTKPYRDMRLSFGRMETLFNDFHDQRIQPIIDTFGKIVKSDVSEGKLLPYITAKSGLERNQVMRAEKLKEWQAKNKNATQAEIDAKEEELSTRDFSGIRPLVEQSDSENMTVDEISERIIDGFESITDEKLVTELWNNIKNASTHILDVWKDGGQLSDKQYDFYKNRMDYFVPLRGWKDGAAKVNRYHPSKGTGASLRRAEGRTSVAENPIAVLQTVGFKAISEQVDNEVKNSMFNLILNNYKPEFRDLYSLKKAHYVKRLVENENGETEEAWVLYRDEKGELATPSEEMFQSGEAKTEVFSEHEKLRAYHNTKEHEVVVKRSGQSYVMIFEKNLPVAQALNRQNTIFKFFGKEYDANIVGENFVFNSLGKVTNFMKGMMTSYNPVFMLTNFFRDQPEAAITQYIRQNARMSDMALKNTPAAVKSIVRMMNGKYNPNNKDDVELKLFYENGGTTGHTHEKTPEQVQKELKNRLKRILRQGSFKGKTIDKLVHIGKYVENMNQIFEDATRYAVFRAARQRGMKVKDAAFESRISSVDFNMKGKGTKMIESIFAFFKAGINALEKNIRLAKDKPAKFTGIAATWAMFGFIEAMLNDLSDDDDEYYRINEYVRHNYLLIPNFFNDKKRYGRIPLPQFWRGFKSFGANIYDLYKGKSTAKEATARTFSNFIAGMAPIDVTGFLSDGKWDWSPVIPTPVKPLHEAFITNKNFMGGTISQTAFTKTLERQLADSKLHKRNVNPAIKLFTDMMYRATRGDGKYQFKMKNGRIVYPMVIDWNPSKIEHVLKGYSGGLGRLASDAITTAAQAISTEEDVDLNNTPFVNSFIRNIPDEKWQVIREWQDINVLTQDFSALKSEAKQESNINDLRELYGTDYPKVELIYKIYDKKIDVIVDRYGFDNEKAGEQITDLMKQAIEKINKYEK